MMKRIPALLIAAVLAAWFTPQPHEVAAQGSLPAGFQETTVVRGLSEPTALAFAPDGRLFVCEKSGTLRVVKNGQLLAAPFVDLSVDDFFERGLLGIAFDPAYAANHYVYLYYTAGASSLDPPPSPKNRVSRFTADGDVASPGSETILLDNIPSDAGNHNAGCLRFGADGKLYVSTGDGGQNHQNSQNLGSLAGKILRLNPDGSFPSDNPFSGQPGRRGEIYCYGLRNPWRFCFRPSNGALFIADVGENTWEEVDLGQSGGNYGWPNDEGPTNAAGIISPLYAYNHNNGGAAIAGGCFISNGTYPSQYQGSYFFGDYVKGFIRRLVVTADNRLQQALDFSSAPQPVDFAQGPEGDLYYVSIGSGTVRRIRSTGGVNHPPTAAATAAPTSGPLPLTVRFSSAGSSDPDGNRLRFTWNFGDGSTTNASNPRHTYHRAGTFNATLTVSDGHATDSATPLRIDAGNHPPVVSIIDPQDGTLYNAGDAIRFSGQAYDPEDGVFSDDRLHWKVVLHHAKHTHPFLTFDGVATGEFVVLRTGEHSADTWYEISLTAADSDGLQTTTSVNIRPRKVRLTFRTTPPGLRITLDDQPLKTPASIVSVVGFDHPVGAPDQTSGGTTWTWSSWSDGGDREHTVEAPSSATTYTAHFSRGP